MMNLQESLEWLEENNASVSFDTTRTGGLKKSVVVKTYISDEVDQLRVEAPTLEDAVNAAALKKGLILKY